MPRENGVSCPSLTTMISRPSIAPSPRGAATRSVATLLSIPEDAQAPVLSFPPLAYPVKEEQQKSHQHERHERHEHREHAAEDGHHVLKEAKKRHRHPRRRDVRRRSQKGFQDRDRARYYRARHELRGGPDTEPGLESHREQHGARKDAKRRLHEVQYGVEGRNLVQHALQESEHEERPDGGPAIQKAEGERQLKEPEPGEEPDEGERQVGPDPRDGGEPYTGPDRKKRFHSHDYSAPLGNNFANIFG